MYIRVTDIDSKIILIHFVIAGLVKVGKFFSHAESIPLVFVNLGLSLGYGGGGEFHTMEKNKRAARKIQKSSYSDEVPHVKLNRFPSARH